MCEVPKPKLMYIESTGAEMGNDESKCRSGLVKLTRAVHDMCRL